VERPTTDERAHIHGSSTQVNHGQLLAHRLVFFFFPAGSIEFCFPSQEEIHSDRVVFPHERTIADRSDEGRNNQTGLEFSGDVEPRGKIFGPFVTPGNHLLQFNSKDEWQCLKSREV
jgi:hypothetical protein